MKGRAGGRFCAVAIVAAFVSGCVSDFGDSVRYLGDPDAAIHVTMPPNAPSIRQEFRITPSASADGGQLEKHEGIDIVAKAGTPIIAAAPGKVTASYADPMYGNQVVIDHGVDGEGLRSITKYRHLAKRTVSAGQVVARGQQIGTMGRTGVLAAGILHLHFEVHHESRARGLEPMDPHLFWADGVGRVTCFDPAKPVDNARFRITDPVPCRGIDLNARPQQAAAAPDSTL